MMEFNFNLQDLPFVAKEILLKVSNEGTAETKYIGIFSKEALDIAISRAW